MARYADAAALAQKTGRPADVVPARRYQTRIGLSANLEQALTSELGLFVRAGEADGALETYEFADIDATLAAGLTQQGGPWKRPDDRFGVALLVNWISRRHEAYQAAGGTGILIGDGRLVHAGAERIVETYYSAPLLAHLMATVDYQFIGNPAYNRDRGPVSVLGLRLHAQY
jgi:high affinity Mn2+ porin